MSGLQDREHYPISVDSVVFGYTEGELKVALIERKKPPFVGMWALPGGFMEGNETIEETALRELKEETGIADVYLQEFGVYSKRGRDPRGPTITIALFALIDSSKIKLVATEDAMRAKWWPAFSIPPLAYDHQEIHVDAIEALRIAVKTGPVAFELLPKEFTLSQLQMLYEQIFSITIDKRNFRRKILHTDFIVPTGTQTSGDRHRPAHLYTFDLQKYVAYSSERFF